MNIVVLILLCISWQFESVFLLLQLFVLYHFDGVMYTYYFDSALLLSVKLLLRGCTRGCSASWLPEYRCTIFCAIFYKHMLDVTSFIINK